MIYNYNPNGEDKTLQIEDNEKDKIENVKEFKVITDTSLEDKYLEQPLLLEDNQIGFLSSINNDLSNTFSVILLSAKSTMTINSSNDILVF